MSRAAVIDASAALSLLRSESGAAVVRARLAEWRKGRIAVHVPAHFWLEVSNALLRRHRLPSSEVIAAIHGLDEVGLDTVELSRPLVLLALDLADRHGLSMYDAAYLALAESADAQLLSFDRTLTAAAGERAITVSGEEHRLSESADRYSTARPTWPRYRRASAYLAQLRADALRGP